jgi:hypothetical protein
MCKSVTVCVCVCVHVRACEYHRMIHMSTTK